MLRTIAAVILCSLVCLTAIPSAPVPGGTVVELEPAKTRVGIARVKLEVRDLRMESSDTIVGNYEIKIPMAPWRNDKGAISLHAPEPLDRLTADGGTLSGSGLSDLDGRTHGIVCEFATDGFVEIHIDTPERDLAFRTRYELITQ